MGQSYSVFEADVERSASGAMPLDPAWS
jgi:hypothetical protein